MVGLCLGRIWGSLQLTETWFWPKNSKEFNGIGRNHNSLGLYSDTTLMHVDADHGVIDQSKEGEHITNTSILSMLYLNHPKRGTILDSMMSGIPKPFHGVLLLC